jgi:hypothetical protein
MNILKSFKDMGAMINAAPGLIESANEMAANAQAMQAAAAAPAQPLADAANLVPIAGVDLAAYARVSKGLGAYGYDAAMLPTVAAANGIAAADWAIAQTGWAARIQHDAGVGANFNALYATV